MGSLVTDQCTPCLVYIAVCSRAHCVPTTGLRVWATLVKKMTWSLPQWNFQPPGRLSHLWFPWSVAVLWWKGHMQELRSGPLTQSRGQEEACWKHWNWNRNRRISSSSVGEGQCCPRGNVLERAKRFYCAQNNGTERNSEWVSVTDRGQVWGLQRRQGLVTKGLRATLRSLDFVTRAVGKEIIQYETSKDYSCNKWGWSYREPGVGMEDWLWECWADLGDRRWQLGWGSGLGKNRNRHMWKMSGRDRMWGLPEGEGWC